MNNKNGVSVISLIITIIVLILITSITLYTGGNMVDQSRIRVARDRLETVASAISAHEQELGFTGIVIGNTTVGTTKDKDNQVIPDDGYRLIGPAEYEIMGLKEYANNDQMSPIYFKKSGDNFYGEKVYKLKTPKSIRTDNQYKDDDYVAFEYTFYDGTYRENIKAEFDNTKGVNRPIVINGMTPVRTYFDNANYIYTEPVINIYDEDWYDYSTASPNWANVILDDTYYVWIPRFAYRIEDFYTQQDFLNIPASAIKVVFLKGTSDYMSNNEALPAGYQVHPAFKYKRDGVEVNLPGIWVAKYNLKAVNSLSNALKATDNSIFGEGNSILNDSRYKLESHLIKNTDWSAVAYLSFATSGLAEPGASLSHNPSSVLELDVPQYVAGAYYTEISNISTDYRDIFDVYSFDDDVLIYESLEKNPQGDAITATSRADNNNSSWFQGTSIYISASQPCIVRGIDDYLFSYSASSTNVEDGLGCRNVLIIQPT